MTERSATRIPVTGERLAAYRARAHDLAGPATLSHVAVLGTGVADYPIGASAHLSLRPRVSRIGPGRLNTALAAGDLVLVHSARGAAHVHRPDDVPLLIAALTVDDGAAVAATAGGDFWRGLPGDAVPAAVVTVARVLAEVAAEIPTGNATGNAATPTITKGDLSAALHDRIDAALRPWCATCRAHHVQDMLFRLATLTAGLRLERTAPSEPVRYRSAGPVTDLPDVDGARRTLLRRFLRVCGPARPADLAGWLGFTPAAARRWWTLLADELEAVDVQGEKAWMHGDDLVDLTCGDAVRGVALIPPRDPFTEVAARDLVVSDPARRRAVWRAAGQPGLVLVDGVPAGTWRHRRSGDKVTVTVDAFYATAIRAAKVAAQVQDEAGRLAAFLGADPAATTLALKD